MHKVIAAITTAFFGFIVWSIYLANTGGSSIFIDYSQKIPDGDKVGHLVLFGTLSLLLNLALKFKVVKIGFLPVYLGSLLVLLFTLFEEVSQDFIPSRTMDIRDFYADCVGIGLSVVVTFFIQRIAEYFNKQQTPS